MWGQAGPSTGKGRVARAHAAPIPAEPPSLWSAHGWGLVAPEGMQEPRLSMYGVGTSAVWSGCGYTGVLLGG